jgi:hypothetical protein
MDDSMKKPNFFIIGAPKCGTTSLADWLRAHPNVFITDPKEPMFFNSDVGFLTISARESYEALFSRAGEEHIAVGEASTWYLWSKEAVPNILQYAPGARFIAMLRFPPEMAMSLHAQECGGGEDVSDFVKAWNLQPERAKGHFLPAFCRAPDLYQYGERCSIGTQLERLLRNIPATKVLILFLEEMAAEPVGQWQRVLRFLELPEFYPGFEARNSRRQIRSFVFKKFLNRIGSLKRRIGVTQSFGLLAPFYKINTRYGVAKQGVDDLDADIRADLSLYFEKEIAKVEKLAGYLPSEWDCKWRLLNR